MNILNKLGLKKDEVTNLLDIAGACTVDNILHGGERIMAVNHKGVSRPMDNKDRKIIADGIMHLSDQYKVNIVSGESLSDFVIRAALYGAEQTYTELESLRRQAATIDA